MTLEEENKRLRCLLTSAYCALHTVANAYRKECFGKSLCAFCAYDPPDGMEYAECPGAYKDDCFRWYLTDNVSSVIPIKEDK